jgi:16S rRNA (uracil1498-N3)-methyltransferase
VTPPLFLLADIPPGDVLYLAGDEGHHAARVRRVTAGEAVLVADGRGTLLHCVVQRVVPDGVHLRVTARDLVAAPQPRVVVVQALPKGERAELAVETMTEVGVDVIVPWSATRSITQWQGARGEKALERWRRVAREAGKQSRRARFPQVAELAATKDVAGLLADAAAGLVLHQDAAAGLSAVALPVVGDIVLVVGPEGGIAEDELAAFDDAGAQAVRLGDGVLRTSTAGAAALAVLSVRLGRWT